MNPVKFTTSSTTFTQQLINIKLFKSIELAILIYDCESWTTDADTERRIQTFEMKDRHRIMEIPFFL